QCKRPRLPCHYSPTSGLNGVICRFRMVHDFAIVLDISNQGANIEISPPIQFRIEWADSQGKVTASWLPAHLILQTNSLFAASSSWTSPLPRPKRPFKAKASDKAGVQTLVSSYPLAVKTDTILHSPSDFESVM